MSKIIGIGCLFQAIIYVTQYILFPIIYVPKPFDEIQSCIIIGLTTFVIVFIGQTHYVKKIYGWALSIFVYPVLVLIYHPNEIYGIGYRGYSLINVVELDVLLWALFVLFVEILTCIILYIIKIIKNNGVY